MRQLHSWNVTPQKAAKIQNRLSGQITAKLPHALPKNFLVAGADISYDHGSNRLFGVVVVVRVVGVEATVLSRTRVAKTAGDSGFYTDLVEIQTIVGRATFPYIPGLLSFREAPLLLKAFAKVKTTPDVLLVDGQGLAHPRRFGIACHLGMLLDIPTIGCAKSRLIGKFGEIGPRRGDWTNLAIAAAGASRKESNGNGDYDSTEIIGRVVRTKDRVKPIYVSVGHKIDLDSAVRVVLACCTRYRLPEPTRQAHLEVNRLRMMNSQEKAREKQRF